MATATPRVSTLRICDGKLSRPSVRPKALAGRAIRWSQIRKALRLFVEKKWVGQYLERKAIYVNVNPEDGPRGGGVPPLLAPGLRRPRRLARQPEKAGVRWVL